MSTSTKNVEKFISNDYHTTGSVLRLKDDTEFYCTGTSNGKRGVILIPDTLGWNAGRIRNIADFFGENNCLAAIPKLLGSSKAAEGPSFTEAFTSPLDYAKDVTIEGNLKPKVSSLVKYMHNEGVERISLIGFSWGGWVVVNLLASDIAKEFVCGALPHPSINLEEKVFGGSLPDLMCRVERPLLLIPTKGDPAEYKSYLKMIRHKLPTSCVVDFPNMDHGFLLRGNINDREVYHATIHSLSQILDFFNHHFEMDLNEIVQGLGESGKEFREGVEKKGGVSGEYSDRGEVAAELPATVTEQMRQAYEYTKQRMASAGERMKQGMASTWEQTKEGVQHAGERVQEGWDATKQRTAEGYEKAKEGAADTYEKAKERTGEGYEKAKEGLQQTGERMQEGWDTTKQRTAEGYEKAKEGVQQTGERMQEGWEQTKQRTGEGYEKAKEGTQQAYEKAKERGQEGYDKAREGTERAGERMQEGYDRTKEGTFQTGEQAGEKMKQTGEQVKQKSQQAGQEHETQKRNK